MKDQQLAQIQALIPRVEPTSGFSRLFAQRLALAAGLLVMVSGGYHFISQLVQVSAAEMSSDALFIGALAHISWIGAALWALRLSYLLSTADSWYPAELAWHVWTELPSKATTNELPSDGDLLNLVQKTFEGRLFTGGEDISGYQFGWFFFYVIFSMSCSFTLISQATPLAYALAAVLGVAQVYATVQWHQYLAMLCTSVKCSRAYTPPAGYGLACILVFPPLLLVWPEAPLLPAAPAAVAQAIVSQHQAACAKLSLDARDPETSPLKAAACTKERQTYTETDNALLADLIAQHKALAPFVTAKNSQDVRFHVKQSLNFRPSRFQYVRQVTVSFPAWDGRKDPLDSFSVDVAIR